MNAIEEEVEKVEKVGFVQYCRQPYHLQDDEMRSNKCFLVSSFISIFVLFIVSMFITYLKFDVYICLYISIPVSIFGAIGLYFYNSYRRKNEIQKRNARYMEHKEELSVLHPYIPKDKAHDLAMQRANANIHEE